MARGGYIRESSGEELPVAVNTNIPARATRRLQQVSNPEETNTKTAYGAVLTSAIRGSSPKGQVALASQPPHPANTVRLAKLLLQPQQRHLLRWMICLVCGVIFLSILLSAAINLRPHGSEFLSFSGSGSYSVQVGGNLANTWEQDHPLASKNPLQPQAGPYSIVGNPSISVDFINQVLAAYHSPAAGKGQALYDLGVQYGIDPTFALAFFMHESSFGTKGEAANSLSLGNLRCIPNFRCQDNFAWFNTWEDGFKAWYELMRNLYVAQWGLTTVDQIIPKYAPEADHNNEAGYIAALKHAIDTWHANVIFVSQ
jgi:hypothetical protein